MRVTTSSSPWLSLHHDLILHHHVCSFWSLIPSDWVTVCRLFPTLMSFFASFHHERHSSLCHLLRRCLFVRRLRDWLLKSSFLLCCLLCRHKRRLWDLDIKRPSSWFSNIVYERYSSRREWLFAFVSPVHERRQVSLFITEYNEPDFYEAMNQEWNVTLYGKTLVNERLSFSMAKINSRKVSPKDVNRIS